MNNLFSSSFSRYRAGDGPPTGDVEMGVGVGVGVGGANLDVFFADVEAVKRELSEIEALHRRLRDANERSKSLHQSSDLKPLRAAMDADVTSALKKAKVVKLKLEALDRANASNRAVPGCGPGSATDRMRTSSVAGLRRSSKETMDAFNSLRERIAQDHREAVGRRYYTVTGRQAEEAVLDELISSGDADRILQRAIQQQGGRGEVMDVVSEMRERRDAVREIERSLVELQQVFLDMAVLVEAQGEQLNDIESNVGRADSFVRGGVEHLQTARVYQRNTRKWVCIGIIVLILILLVVVTPIAVNASKK